MRKTVRNKIVLIIIFVSSFYILNSCSMNNEQKKWFSRYSYSMNSYLISISDKDVNWPLNISRSKIEGSEFMSNSMYGKLYFGENKVFIKWSNSITCISSTLFFDISAPMKDTINTYWPSFEDTVDTLTMTLDTSFYQSVYLDTIYKFTIYNFGVDLDEDWVFYVGKEVGFVGYYGVCHEEEYVLCVMGNLFFDIDKSLLKYNFSPRLL